METQKVLKIGKIVVLCDYREREIIEILRHLGTEANEMNLEVADFICSDKRVAIERKTHSDFISSIIDGRVFEQAKNLKENFEIPVLIIEGYSDSRINENALMGATASLLVDFGISMVRTKNPYDTARMIYWIAKKEQEEKGHGVSFKVGKKPKNIKELQLFILSGIPGVSAKTSEKLLERFKSIRNVFSASQEELEKVLGKKRADNIYKIINKKW